MFEMTISTSKAKSKDITFMLNRLRPQIKTLKGIIVCEESEGRMKLGIAVYDDKKDIALGFIFDAVSEAIVRDYKEEYLMNNIKFKWSSKVTAVAFIKALTMFDKASDKDLIKKHLKPCEEILLDSLYKFRLWELEKKWQEIVSLVSDNSNYLLMSGTFTELMKFLILTNETEFGEVHVHEDKGIILGKSVEGKELFSLKYREKDDNSKISVLSELICLSPEKIVLHNDINDQELSSFIVSLFDGRVSLIK